MIYKISDSLYTPLGEGIGVNLERSLGGRTELALWPRPFGLPEDAVLSLFDRCKLTEQFAASFPHLDIRDYSFFEKITLLAGHTALAQAGEAFNVNDSVMVLSTTKGNVDALPGEHKPLALTAAKIGQALGLGGRNCLVVSNACVSGVCAMSAACDLLESGFYRSALVIGADVLSAFIVSGFQSFKALSDSRCRPYDASRKGLNLGEGAAAVTLLKTESPLEGKWCIKATSNHNDANHISGPSRTGEGTYRVLCDLLASCGCPDVINTHGTATLYNDEMEAIALDRAGLTDVPVCGLKGVFGHTLGAAGVLESVLTLAAADKGLILPTPGYVSSGVSRELDISATPRRKNDIRTVFKILSGFGGSNAGIAFSRND